MDLKDLKMYQRLQELDTTLSEQTKTIYELTYETINNISKFYDNYTMHDMNHGLRVASYMEQLAFGIDEKFNDRISKYNALELTLMILSAILHDIGMTIRDIDKENITNNKIEHTESLTFKGVMKVVNNNEDEAIKEIIRRTHAARIFDFINCDIGGKTISSILMIDNSYPYAEDVAEICKAHGEDHSHLKTLRIENTKGKYTYNLQYIAALLRIADYLDLDKQRTPILWYSVMRIEGFSREEWEKNFTIQNSTKLKEYIDGKMQIYFDGKSSDAKIHRKYLRYIDELKIEYVTYYDLYSHFVPGLIIITDNPKENRFAEFFLQKEIMKLDQFCEEQNLLCGNNVESYEDLIALKEDREKESLELVELP